jgi:hypothetical protein
MYPKVIICIRCVYWGRVNKVERMYTGVDTAAAYSA